MSYDRRYPERMEVSLSIIRGEVSPEFVKGMADRMSVSFHKYGAVKDATGLDPIRNLEERLALFKETGNGEWLMDAANFAMIAFMTEDHPEFHYRPTDSDESPGRWGKDGRWKGSKQNLDVEVPQ